jgi:hypothetical protein
LHGKDEERERIEHGQWVVAGWELQLVVSDGMTERWFPLIKSELEIVFVGHMSFES